MLTFCKRFGAYGILPRMTETRIARRWPAEIIETAYQVWAGAAKQNVSETVRLLAGILPEVPPVNTVHLWRHRQDWANRDRSELAVAARLPGQMHVERLQVAGLEATEYLASVTTGRVIPDTDRIKAAMHLESAARSLILQAAKQSTDGRRKRQPPQPERGTVDVDTLDSAQLEQYEREQRDRRDSG